MFNDPNTESDALIASVLKNFKYLDQNGKRAGFFIASLFMNSALTKNIEGTATLFCKNIMDISLTDKSKPDLVLATILRLMSDAILTVQGYRNTQGTKSIKNCFSAKEENFLGSFEKNMLKAIEALIAEIEKIKLMISSNDLIEQIGQENRIKHPLLSKGKRLKKNTTHLKQTDWKEQEELFRALKTQIISEKIYSQEQGPLR